MIDVHILQSAKLFSQPRDFYFRVFKREYERYKKWIEPDKGSGLPIDVIIPAIEKDMDILPYTVRGIRKHIMHPIRQVYIVAPQSASIRQIADKLGCVFVNEQDICNIQKQDINFVYNGYDRSGWIYQQFLKLNFDKVGEVEHHLVVDADTVFIKDVAFESKGKLYFDFSDEYHTPYYSAYELLTGIKHTIPVSFVSHYMLFGKKEIKQMRNHVQQHTNRTIEEAIIALKDSVQNQSNFSEYETYANFCINTYSDAYRIRYWFNKSCMQNDIAMFDMLKKEHGNSCKSLSFHSHAV